MSSSPSSRWRAPLLSGLVVGTGGFLAWAVTADLNRSTAVATLAGLFLSVGSLAIAIVQLWPRQRPTVDRVAAAAALADDVSDQWVREAAARSVQAEGAILPVAWTVQTAVIADPEQPDHPWLERGQGRLDGNFAAAAAAVAEEYRRVANRRLVVLGEPGAGKTVIAMLLTVGLLDRRRRDGEQTPPSPDNPVPVLLAASSWDPVCESFDDWVVDAVALAHYHGDRRIPRMLLDSRLLLPVVDGLDEIPESARRTAVHRLNRAVGMSRPIVVTCRAAEYEDAIRGGAPALLRTPVVRVRPVPPADTMRYVRQAVDDTDCDRWRKVLDTLRDQPVGPLAEALSTPLMVSLLVAEYGPVDTRPEELLESVTAESRHAIEDHLLDHAIAARFAGPNPTRYDPERATRWLTFLATYLHRHRERDLAWWRMSERLMPRLAVPAAGLLLGLLLMVLVSVVTRPLADLIDTGVRPTEAALTAGMIVGGAFAVLFTLIWYAVPSRLPGRLVWAPAEAWGRVRRSLLVGFAVLVMPGAAALVAATAVTTLTGEWNYQTAYTIMASGVLTAAAGCALGSGLAADAWLSAPPERSSQPSPGGFLRHDRRSALVGAAATALVVTAVLVPLALVGTLLGDWAGHAVAAFVGFGERPDGIVPLDAEAGWNWDEYTTVASTLVGSGLGVGLLTRAWPRFLVMRAYLALRGDLPWRLPAFLAEARDRNLLRECGGVWQFHHVRLQERLASRPAVDVAPTRQQHVLPQRQRQRRAMLHVGTAVVILTAITATVVDPPARSTVITLSQPWGVKCCVSVEALSRDGIVAVGYDEGVLAVWKVNLDQGRSSHAGVHQREVTRAAETVAVSNNGARVALATTHAVSLIPLDGPAADERWTPLPAHPGFEFGRRLVFTPKDELLAVYISTVDDTIILVPVTADDTVQPVPANEDGPAGTSNARVGTAPAVAAKANQPTTNFAQAVHHDDNHDTIRYHSGPTAPDHKSGHTGSITAMAYTDDGTTLVTGSDHLTIRFHPPTNDRPPLTSSQLYTVRALALPDGDDRRVVAADGDTVEVWHTGR